MRKLFFALCLALLFFPKTVFAACPPLQGVKPDEVILYSFSGIAEKMGAGCPAYYNETDKGTITVQYVPDGQTLENWTSTVSLSLIVSEGAETQLKTIAMRYGFLSYVRQAGGDPKIIHKEQVKGSGGLDEVWYGIKFDLKNEGFWEDGIAVIRTVDEGALLNIQYRQREKPLKVESAFRFMRLCGLSQVGKTPTRKQGSAK